MHVHTLSAIHRFNSSFSIFQVFVPPLLVFFFVLPFFFFFFPPTDKNHHPTVRPWGDRLRSGVHAWQTATLREGSNVDTNTLLPSRRPPASHKAGWRNRRCWTTRQGKNRPCLSHTPSLVGSYLFSRQWRRVERRQLVGMLSVQTWKALVVSSVVRNGGLKNLGLTAVTPPPLPVSLPGLLTPLESTSKSSVAPHPTPPNRARDHYPPPVIDW